MAISKIFEKEMARKLRVENRLSISAIAKELNVSKGSVSVWLRDVPLSNEEKHQRYVDNGKRTGLTRQNNSFSKLERSSKYSDMLGSNKLTNNQKGKIAESAVLLRLSILQFEIYKSIFDGERLDLIICSEKSKTPIKVQVRWASAGRQGRPSCSLRRSDGRGRTKRWSNNDFDFIVGYDIYSDTCYVWNFDDVSDNTRCITCAEKYAEQWNKLIEFVV